METESIIKQNLAFLIDKYSFSFSSVHDGCQDYYIFENQFGKIVFYEWAERKEMETTVFFSNEAKRIDFFLENTKRMAEYYKRCSGLRGFFFDGRAMYWEIVSETIRTEISRTGTIWGLRIIERCLSY